MSKGSTRANSSSPTRHAATTTTATRIKQQRETRLLFEQVAKTLMKENESDTKFQLEFYCRELVGQQLADFRQDLMMIESTFSNRMVQLDGHVLTLNKRVSDIEAETSKNIQLLVDHVDKSLQQFTSSVETERSKRLSLGKSLQAKEEKNIGELKQMIMDSKNDMMKTSSTLQEDIKSQNNEILRLRGNIDEM